MKPLPLALLVAVTVVGIFYFWQRGIEQRSAQEIAAHSAVGAGEVRKDTAAQSRADSAAELGSMLEKALAGYNSGDTAQLFADFSTQATPPPSTATQRNLFEGVYKAELGRLLSGHPVPAASAFEGDGPMLVWDAVFEKAPHGRVSVNFTREADGLKIVQIRMEKLGAER